jgi:hypothetical protein
MSETDAFGRHEVLHVANIVTKLFSDEIVDHGAVKADPEWAAKADAVAEALAQFYLYCGDKTLDDAPSVK